VQVYWSHVLCKASYSQFCVKIRDFSLSWQQGRSEEIRLTPSNVPTLNTPKLVQIHVPGLYVLCILSYSYFVLQFANFRYHGNRGQSEQFLTVTFKHADPKTPY